ncbi:MAG: zinc ribbon domain-containing protein [Candidatus Eisenbacteria bacterium]|nr:zinc ribbon domain-containing protein [Candidatus Eisenbacteria bacterium]
MPFYEYRCKTCNEVWAVMRGVALRDEPIECPECRGEGERILSAFSTVGSSARAAGGADPGGSCSPTFG